MTSSTDRDNDDGVPVNELLTKDIKAKLCNSLVKNCERILKEIPIEDHRYKYWDVYTGNNNK